MNRLLFILFALVAFLSPLRADDKSDWDVLERKSAHPKLRTSAAKSIAERARKEGTCETVSYTHLTLPTILRV